MLVDVAAAWQRADAEQRLCVQNFLFQGGIAYHQNQKFLNTTNPTLFQQLRGLVLPVAALSHVFRGKFTAELKQLFLQHKLQFHGSLQSTDLF